VGNRWFIITPAMRMYICSSLTGDSVDRTGLTLRDKMTRTSACKRLEAGTKSFGSLGTNKVEVSANSYYFYYRTFILSTYMHTYIHTRTRTRTRTYIHTYIHTYIYTFHTCHRASRMWKK